MTPPESETCTTPNFVRLYNDDELWCPRHNDHDKWIQHLVAKLIDGGSISDEILRLLAPICRVKVRFYYYTPTISWSFCS